MRSAASRQLVLVLLIQASLLFKKMTRASLDSIPENAVFFKIPVQINGSRSYSNSKKSEHVLPWMVTKEPLLVSQTPLNAVRVWGCGGCGENVLMLQTVVGVCDATSG